MHSLEQLKDASLMGTERLDLQLGLDEFPTDVYRFADSLKILNMSGNKLSELPDDFACLQKLEIVFLSDNCFTELPAVLAQCPNLSMVGFKANQISHWSEDALPTSVRWLILTDNRITKIPDSIGSLASLQKCMLAGNQITTLPESMRNCEKLELLRISANKIKKLPSWLLSMPRLSWLAIAGNKDLFSDKSDTEELPVINWSDLTVGSLLGQGASGVISRAVWQSPLGEKEVAVKVFKGEVTSDGLPDDEMKATVNSGAHENLVNPLGKVSGHPNHKQALVFPIIDSTYEVMGQPPSFTSCTRDNYEEGTNFSIDASFKIAKAMASSLQHLHHHQILHGDFYPHNILITSDGDSLLTDFGAGSLVNGIDEQQRLALEKIEVRAFGYLLEDLLNHCNEENDIFDKRNFLENLMQQCLSTSVASRPSFLEITNQLV